MRVRVPLPLLIDQDKTAGLRGSDFADTLTETMCFDSFEVS